MSAVLHPQSAGTRAVPCFLTSDPACSFQIWRTKLMLNMLHGLLQHDQCSIQGITWTRSWLIWPALYAQDVSFWLPESGFTENNLCEVVRGIAGDLVESVELIDNFTNPKKQKTSNCYRIAYRSMDRSLTDEEINGLQDSVRSSLTDDLKVELR